MAAMRRTYATLAGAAVLAATILTVPTPALAATCTATPRLAGTFVQPYLIDGWTDAQVSAELDHLAAACIRHVIVQWTADTKHRTTVYPTSLSGYTHDGATDVVGRLLSAAQAKGVSVWLGLQVNEDWWSRSADDGPWLAAEATRSVAVANELYDSYGGYASFDGWYLPFEVDNVNFTDPAAQTRMADYYRTVIGALDAASGGLPVAAAPFFNAIDGGGQTPAQWQAMWTRLLRDSPIDVVALQDGVGAGHARTADLAAWFRSTDNAIAASRPSTRLFADTETFVMGSSGFQPMPVADFVAHMKAVQPYVDGYWSFAYSHYQSPQGPFGTAHHRAYLNYLATPAPDTTPPSAPATLSATANSPQRITLSWPPSTDNLAVTGYRIYRGGALVATRPGTSVSFVDNQLDGATTYTYTVRAYDAAGNVSPPSPAASARTPAMPSYPTNLAAGRRYTASVPASPSYPDSGGELTNGARGAATYGPAWQGRDGAGVHTFTVDLGAVRTFQSVSSGWLQIRPDAVFLPVRVTYRVSTDGSAFTSVGTVNRPAVSTVDQVRNYRLIALSASARYVRVEVDGGTAWSMLDEIEVRSG
jgi:hypothetical protein